MSVSVENGIVRLVAPWRVEDAEPLWSALRAAQAAGQTLAVDLSGAGLPHAAILQLLLVFRPRILAEPDHRFWHDWVSPLLAAQGAGQEAADTVTTAAAATGGGDPPAR